MSLGSAKIKENAACTGSKPRARAALLECLPPARRPLAPCGGARPCEVPFPTCWLHPSVALDDSWGDHDGVETQAPGWGQWAAFPGDPPPRPAASPDHPVPPRPPGAAPGSGTAGASGPASGRGRGRRGVGRGSSQAGSAVLLPRGRRRCQERSLLVASTEAIGLPVLPSRADLLPPPRGERLEGAPARGAPTAEGTSGPRVALAEPRGRAVGVRAARAGAPCHPGAVCRSLSLPLVPARRPGPSGVSSGRGAWVRRAGRLCRGSVGMALRSQRLVPLAPRPCFQRNEATPGSWISPEGPRAS